MSDKRLYPKLSPMDLEPHYCRHVGAMTSEGLHAKSDIAIQLAWRDKQISELRGLLEECEDAVRFAADAAATAWFGEKSSRYAELLAKIRAAQGGLRQQSSQRDPAPEQQADDGQGGEDNHGP